MTETFSLTRKAIQLRDNAEKQSEKEMAKNLGRQDGVSEGGRGRGRGLLVNVLFSSQLPLCCSE